MASLIPDTSTTGSPPRKTRNGRWATARPGNAESPILVDSSATTSPIAVDRSRTETMQSDISIACSHASRRSAADSATRVRVEADLRAERARQLRDAALAAAEAARAAIARFEDEEAEAQDARAIEEQALDDCGGSQQLDSLPDLSEEVFADPFDFAEVDSEKVGDSPTSVYNMDAADSEKAVSHYGLDGDDSDEDLNDALPRQLAEISAEDPYIALDGGYIPDHDIQDIYRPGPSQGPVIHAMEFVPDQPMQDEYRPVPTRACAVPSRMRGRSVPVSAFGHTAGFDTHDIYGSSPCEPSLTHT